jgi:hypothetical protein
LNPGQGGDPRLPGFPAAGQNGNQTPDLSKLQKDLSKLTIPPPTMHVNLKELSPPPSSNNLFSWLPGSKVFWLCLLLSAGLAGVFNRPKPAGKGPNPSP